MKPNMTFPKWSSEALSIFAPFLPVPRLLARALRLTIDQVEMTLVRAYGTVGKLYVDAVYN